MINCYPVAGKRKSLDICAAFAAGCRGNVVTNGRWRPGPSMFYGVDDSNLQAWRETLANQLEFDLYYADNAYFDKARGTYFRVAKNRLQHPGAGGSDGIRLAQLGVTMHPRHGDPDGHILVCPQSDAFMRTVVGYRGDWVADIKDMIRKRTDRPIVVREWSRDKASLGRSLHADLAGAAACVTWSSAAGIEAVLAGVPSIAMGQSAAHLVSARIDALEGRIIPLPAPEAVHQWAAVLADNQWTLDEMRSGMTMDWFNRGKA